MRKTDIYIKASERRNKYVQLFGGWRVVNSEGGKISFLRERGKMRFVSLTVRTKRGERASLIEKEP